MKIKFLGGGASEGIPGIFCDCALCREAREKGKFFTRSQVLIEDDLLIDFPPDSYYRSLLQGTELGKVKSVVVTHSHSDHFYAEDFFMRGLWSSFGLRTPSATVYASKAVTDMLERIGAGIPRGGYVHKAVGKVNGYDEYPHSVEYVNISPFEVFQTGEYRVTALPSAHIPSEPSFVFAVERAGKAFLYATDTAPLPKEVYDFLQKGGYKFGAVAYDGTYGSMDFDEGHMNFADCEAMRAELVRRGLVSEETKHVVTHVSHNAARSLKALLDGLPEGFLLASDGTEVVL